MNRILHVITAIGRGGAENHLVDLVRHQRACGHAVTVAYLRGNGYWAETFREMGATVHDLGLRCYGDWRPLRKLRRVIDDGAFDLVHAHLPPAELYVRFALFGSALPMLITKHNEERFCRLPGHRLLGRWVGARAAHIITISDAVKRYIAGNGLGLDARKLHTVYYGIDAGEFGGMDGGSLREEWGIPRDALVIGFVGRLVEQKDIGTLIRGLAQFPKARLVIVGTGPVEAAMRRLAEKLGVTDRIVWAGFRDDIQRVMSAFDIFALTSIYEGFGLVLAEAMASRRVIVATRVGSIPEVVGETGLLVNPRSPGELAAAFQQLSDRSLRERLGEAGRQRVLDEFPLERMWQATDSLYEQCLRPARSLRLLFVIPRIISYAAFLRELGAQLNADGAEIHVACSREAVLQNDPSTAPPPEVHLHPIEFARGMNPARHLRAARELDRLIRTIQPDIVHAHFSAAIFTTALAHRPSWPMTMATFHGVSCLAMTGWKMPILRLAESWAARRFDAVWVLTEDDREGLRAAAPGAVVHTLASRGMGCDLTKFTPLSISDRTALRAKLGFQPEQIVFAFVGRFTNFKGFGTTVRAFLKLAAGNPNARLLLIGDTDPLHSTGLDPHETEQLKASPQVINTGFRADVERVLAAADVMVFPSRREGMPVCLMEALALGVPAITSDSRGCREVVRNEVDGLVLRDDSVENLYHTMQRVAAEPDLRRRWAEQAIAGRGRFDRAHFIAEQKRIYARFTKVAQPAAGILEPSVARL